MRIPWKPVLSVPPALIYPPGVYSTREEMVNFARVVKAHDGIYTSHIRSESYGLIDAVTEAIHIAEETGVSVEISHHKGSRKAQPWQDPHDPADDCRCPRKRASM